MTGLQPTGQMTRVPTTNSPGLQSPLRSCGAASDTGSEFLVLVTIMWKAGNATAPFWRLATTAGRSCRIGQEPTFRHKHLQPARPRLQAEIRAPGRHAGVSHLGGERA